MTAFKRKKFDRLDFEPGQKHDSGKHSRNSERVEVLFLSSSSRTESKASTDASARILSKYPVSYRCGHLWLNIDMRANDIEEPLADATSQLQAWMESGQMLRPKSLPWGSGTKGRSRLFVIVDETVSGMIKEIMSHHKSTIHENMVGLVFLQDNRTTERPEIQGRQGTGKIHQQHADSFDTLFLEPQNAVFQERTWILVINQECNGERFDDLLLEPIQVAIYQLIGTGVFQSQDRPITRATSNHQMQTRRYLDYLNAPRPPALEAHEDWQNTEDKAQFLHLRHHAETCLLNNHLKHALIGFQRCLEMTIPWDDARWEITGSLALVWIGLGDYAKADEELQKLLGTITCAGLDHKGRETVARIRREAVFRRALALSLQQKHSEALKCLSMMEIPEEHEQPSIQVEIALLQGKTFRLQALSNAHLGFQDLQNVKNDLVKADRCYKGLTDIPPLDRERSRRVDMFIYRCAEISTSVSKSRVMMLQGDYRGALKVLQPALRDAILKIGETNALTLEATLLSCQLQILTGEVRLGRKSCERCADVIVDALGPEHNLALEAEYLLIAAAQAEGLLSLALENSLALFCRTESRADFGRKHPATLRYRSQLGGLQLQHGNYLEAESTLASVWTDSTEVWSLEHPHTLSIQSQLALARYHLGNLEQAESDILTALRGQFKTYLRISTRDLWQGYDRDGDFLEKGPFRRVKAIYSTPRLDLDDPMPHPDILSSFLTWGKVLSRKQEPNLNLVFKIFRFAHVSASEQLGPSHELSLAASLAIGELFSLKAQMESDAQKQQDYYLKAASYYDSVVRPRPSIDDRNCLPDTRERAHEAVEDSPIMQRPGRNHPIALQARHEFLVVSILGCDDVEDNIKCIQSGRKELEFILTSQRSRLGWNHPHTLKTLFSLLALQVGLDESREEVLKTHEELMGRLTRKDIRGQRLLECLLMEEKVIGVLYDRHDMREERRIVEERIRVAVADSDAIDPSLRAAVEKIKDRTGVMLRSLT